jgi:hypothetical protein
MLCHICILQVGLSRVTLFGPEGPSYPRVDHGRVAGIGGCGPKPRRFVRFAQPRPPEPNIGKEHKGRGAKSGHGFAHFDSLKVQVGMASKRD